jgi:hypothetical protein
MVFIDCWLYTDSRSRVTTSPSKSYADHKSASAITHPYGHVFNSNVSQKVSYTYLSRNIIGQASSKHLENSLESISSAAVIVDMRSK